MDRSHVTALIRKLENGTPFAPEEIDGILALPVHIAQIRAGQDIVREGDRPTRSCLLIDGYISATKTTGDGGRQITSFYVAGDIPDLQSLHLTVMDIAFATLTPCTVGFIPHIAIQTLCRQFPRIASAMWRSTLVDAAIYRDWVANVGQRPSLNRLAHLLCELLARSRAAGYGEDHSCELPMNQTELADALGMSLVHVNRTLSKLRADGLIAIRKRQLTALDWPGLMALGDFDPAYLHLPSDPTA
ncbi:MAG TPA: Crp/Fnr family transcriptional regulator [Xanthobacteraceae bacterium]|nr:Crp/Fnr family transcriptional regulator [Xanthobacteraceae bacterium]